MGSAHMPYDRKPARSRVTPRITLTIALPPSIAAVILTRRGSRRALADMIDMARAPIDSRAAGGGGLRERSRRRRDVSRRLRSRCCDRVASPADAPLDRLSC